jgi:hypothetical protein
MKCNHPSLNASLRTRKPREFSTPCFPKLKSDNPTKPVKSKNAIRSAFLLLASSAALSNVSYSQTVEINPAGAIPAAYSLAQGWEWNTDGALQSWTANTQFTLDAGTPIGGSVTGVSAGNDPTFTSPTFAVATPYRVIVEFRVKKETSDTSRIDLLWTDTAGGFGGPRLYTVQPATLAADDTFKTVRISFPAGSMATTLSKLRFDPIADAAGIGKTVALDYLRVYNEVVPVLNWDADTLTTGAQGGTGTWDQATTANWWNGTADTTWDGTSVATFAGTAGTVTVAGGGVTANLTDFQTTGYTVSGGPINVGSDFAIYKVTTATTRIDSALTGSAPLKLQGSGTNPGVVLGGSNTALSGGVTQAVQYLGITNDNAVGTGTFTVGAGGNTYITSLNGDRALANNVVFAGNRMLIQNTDLGTGLPVGNLIINGNLALNCISPGDLYLRKNLTVNGVVSGSNSGIGLFLAGDVNTLKLTNTNTFTGGVKWSNSSVIEVSGDSALGAAANNLTFSAGAGTLRALASFSSARAINISGSTTSKIDTNGFDVALSGGHYRHLDFDQLHHPPKNRLG